MTTFSIEQKENDSIQDIMIPQLRNPLKRKQKPPKSWFKKEREQNIYIKLVEDLFRVVAFLIKGTRHIIRSKFHKV